ncbi:septal ring lytic transglycosylase RlpA family protein [Janthinobacterium sp. 17J80-10]|uniref:septal ring lytic transglycosylase RlpA family protein n=1 Tax=Janthinobacterium sp. 17J80-10 TaxID=2497863 RepID=UPI0010056BF4|nr:septal ring lytic transglycosylase RlpA family protein [Janthinobacterium sp. 17J80-10]QAU33200.1 septal ring lytic transglycosylase RlpA family protein [Janthinobacterium sp. 17J80-10]
MPANRIRNAVARRQIANVLPGMLCALVLAACGSLPQTPADQSGAKTAPTAASKRPGLPPAGSGRGGYYQDDGPGDAEPEGLLATPDAEPKVEPYAKSGNRPYVVFGKTYTPFLDERPFRQRGRGSWYGKKFHGQRTSSGEPYDMYKMTAAHPTLPIPSYARVTNVANGRQVIVRVNDRGPFHSSRIMDLSYTAALKLGYLQHGSAELEIERLLPEEVERMSVSRPPKSAAAPDAVRDTLQAAAPAAQPVAVQAVQKPEVAVFSVPVANAVTSATASATSAGESGNAVAAGAPVPGGFYLQLGAYSQAESAESARARLQKQWDGTLPSIEVQPGGAVFRLMSGPFASRDEADAIAQKLIETGSVKSLVVRR